MLLLNNTDVRKVLSMSLCLSALDGVFAEMAVREAVGMGRIDVYVPSSGTPAPYYRWSVMTGGSRKDGYVATRIMSDMVAWPRVDGRVREEKYAREPGTYCGFLLVFSARDGVPVALINDGVLQHERVGAGAGLGTKYLSRADSRSVGMIGTGGMARSYLEAFCLVRPIERVTVYSPNAEHVRRYAEQMSAAHGIEVRAATSAREAVLGADIVACCTSANEPVFLTEWLEPGMHVVNVSSSEFQHDLPGSVDVAARAGEATQRLEQLPSDAGYARNGYLSYIAGTDEERAVIPHLDLPREILDMPRLVDLLGGSIKGRVNDEQTTFFLNSGAIGAQFEAVAATVYERARDLGLGQEIPTEWFLEDIRD